MLNYDEKITVFKKCVNIKGFKMKDLQKLYIILEREKININKLKIKRRWNIIEVSDNKKTVVV